MIIPCFLMKTGTGFMGVRIEADGSHRELVLVRMGTLPDHVANMSLALVDLRENSTDREPAIGTLVKYVGKIREGLRPAVREAMRSYEVERIEVYEKEREFFENLVLGHTWDQLILSDMLDG